MVGENCSEVYVVMGIEALVHGFSFQFLHFGEDIILEAKRR